MSGLKKLAPVTAVVTAQTGGQQYATPGLLGRATAIDMSGNCTDHPAILRKAVQLTS